MSNNKTSLLQLRQRAFYYNFLYFVSMKTICLQRVSITQECVSSMSLYRISRFTSLPTHYNPPVACSVRRPPTRNGNHASPQSAAFSWRPFVSARPPSPEGHHHPRRRRRRRPEFVSAWAPPCWFWHLRPPDRGGDDRNMDEPIWCRRGGNMDEPTWCRRGGNLNTHWLGAPE